MGNDYLGGRIRTADNPMLLLHTRFLPVWHEAYLELYNKAVETLRKSNQSIAPKFVKEDFQRIVQDTEALNRWMNWKADKDRGASTEESYLNDAFAFGTLSPRRSYFDMSMEVVLLLDPEDLEWTYFRYFGRPQWYGLLMEQEWVEDFFYTNRTDSQIEELGEAGYEQRAKTWARLMQGYEPPGELGFTWSPPHPVKGIQERIRNARVAAESVDIANSAMGWKPMAVENLSKQDTTS